jgi:hypothetical protein
MIGSLDIPVPFDLKEFCNRLERSRGRVLRLVPIISGPVAPCGAWVRTREADYVFHETGTSPLHQQHIALHEIGHILLNHRGCQLIDTGIASLLMPDLDPKLILSMLRRTVYDSEDELQAEAFAEQVSLLSRPTDTVHSEPIKNANPEQVAVVSRIERTVGCNSQAPSACDSRA